MKVPSALRWFLSVVSAALLLSLSWFSALTDVIAPPPLSGLDLERLSQQHHGNAALLRSQQQPQQQRDDGESGEPRGPRRRRRRRRRHHVSPGEIALSRDDASSSCPEGLVYVDNRVDDGDAGSGEPPTPLPRAAVPRRVHQTSKSRCVGPKFADTISRWRFENWSHYFYDDEAVARLFESEADTFPHLNMVANKCMLHGAVKSDVFRYVVLYRYGGIYADLDSAPNHFTPERYLHDDVDGLFVVEAYGLLSQYFMALSPRHPLMWYAVQHSLSNLLRLGDTGRVGVATITGPHALHAAFQSFRRDAGYDDVGPVQKGGVQSGTYLGTNNRSITVVGAAGNWSNEIVHRDVLVNDEKEKMYGAMAMRHFRVAQREATNRSCLSALYDLHDEAATDDEDDTGDATDAGSGGP